METLVMLCNKKNKNKKSGRNLVRILRFKLLVRKNKQSEHVVEAVLSDFLSFTSPTE